MSKIILKNIEAPSPPSEGQVVIYAQGGAMRTWSHGGSPTSLSNLTVQFYGLLNISGGGFEFPEPPPSEYFFDRKASLVFPLASDVTITSIAVYVHPDSLWNVPLSIRAYRGISGEDPVNVGELIVLDTVEEPGPGPKREEGLLFGGTVAVESGLSVSLDGDSYMTIAVVPVTEEPGDVYVEVEMTIVLTMSQT